MTTQLTRNYWLDVFAGWVEARDMPGPQNDEALTVINELKAAEARAAELAAQLAAVTEERNRFADELSARGYKPRCTCTMDDNMHEPSCSLTEWTRIRFERSAPVDWRDAYQGETPLGIALDGLGDEVEP